MESARDESLLLVLNIQHLLLHRLLGDELVDEDLLGLAEPVYPVEALPLAGGVPGGVQKQEMVGSCEVQPDSTSLAREKSVKSEEKCERRERAYLKTEQHHGGTVLPVTLEHLHSVRPDLM